MNYYEYDPHHGYLEIQKQSNTNIADKSGGEHPFAVCQYYWSQVLKFKIHEAEPGAELRLAWTVV